MKQLFLIVFIAFQTFTGTAQESDRNGRIGVALNSSLNSEVYPLRVVPTLTYLMGNNQFELGVGFHPFIRKDQQLVSGEFSYKYLPNGINNKFNIYLIGHFSYIHNPRETYYPTKYNYLFLNGGYGFQLNASKNLYLGTNFTVGVFTYSKRTEIPYEAFAKKDLFDEFGFNLAFQFNVGYRF